MSSPPVDSPPPFDLTVEEVEPTETPAKTPSRALTSQAFLPNLQTMPYPQAMEHAFPAQQQQLPTAIPAPTRPLTFQELELGVQNLFAFSNRDPLLWHHAVDLYV